jgi:hypothetical protein
MSTPEWTMEQGGLEGFDFNFEALIGQFSPPGAPRRSHTLMSSVWYDEEEDVEPRQLRFSDFVMEIDTEEYETQSEESYDDNYDEGVGFFMGEDTKEEDESGYETDVESWEGIPVFDITTIINTPPSHYSLFLFGCL